MVERLKIEVILRMRKKISNNESEPNQMTNVLKKF